MAVVISTVFNKTNERLHKDNVKNGPSTGSLRRTFNCYRKASSNAAINFRGTIIKRKIINVFLGLRKK